MKKPPRHGTNNRYQSRYYSCRCEKCKKAHAKYMYKYRRKTGFNHHKADFTRIFKTEYKWYQDKLISQNGKCAICKKEPNGIRLGVDHNHNTGNIRGLLCFKCNSAIGLLGEDMERLLAAINYLYDYEVAP